MTESPHTDDYRLPNILWLGQEVNSPYEIDQSLAAGLPYEQDSTDGNWPVFSYTKAHRLHDIKTLCDACDKIDIAGLVEGDTPSILRESWLDVLQTAKSCRFCSLIAQSTRGYYGFEYRKGFRYVMGNQDVPSEALPVRLGLRHGKLEVSVSYPVSWNQNRFQGDGWDLGSFDIFIGKDAPLAEEMVDLSTSERGQTIPTALISPQQIISRLAEELRRIISFTACETCIVNSVHMNCTRSQWLVKDTPPILPDRVLELLDTPATDSIKLHLLETNGSRIGYYIALSHRWGGDLTLKTTNNTLSQRLEGFYLEDLPRTFRDAVLVAKALGIIYIWVDSLCIIQDNRKDWLEQSTKMGSIYMNSTFTIAAHSAGQCNECFLWRSQVSSALSILPKQGGPEFLVSIPDIYSGVLPRRFLESEISHRAWILQELTLSPRILHFVENRCFWECEHRSPEINGSTLETSATIFRDALGGSSVHTMWLKLVSQYSNHQMTKDEDKLIALAGIVDVWQGVIERPNDRYYHFGVFQEDIERSLLWYIPDKAIRHLQRAPSWSWASTDGRLYFLPLELSEPPRKLVQVLQFLHHDYLNFSGEKRQWKSDSVMNLIGLERWSPSSATWPGCRLIVQAPVIQITSQILIEKSKKLQNVPLHAPRWMVALEKDGSLRTIHAWCIPDENLFPGGENRVREGEFVALSFLAISGREINGEIVGVWCVIISLENLSLGMYRRVGLGYVRDKDLIGPALAAPETITLV